MKVVVATPLYPPEIGGPATYAELLVAGLPKEGVTVGLIKFSEVRHLPKLVRHYAYFRRVLKAAHSADLVMALDPVSVGLPAFWAAHKLRKPLVVKVVGDYAWEQGRQRFGITQDLDTFVGTMKVPLSVKILRWIQSRVAHGATKIIVPSEYLKKIVTAWGIPSEKIQVIYNAVIVTPLGEIPEHVQQLKQPFLLTAGRLVPWKHMDAVIEAVESLPEFSLVVAGEGPEEGALKRRAEKLGNRVVFTGALSHPDLLATIKAARAFVLNSSYEGLSHVLIEAVLLGTPVVATRAGGNEEVVTEGVSGILVPPGDTSALIAALRSPQTCTQANQTRFSEESMVRETAEFLQNI